MNYFIINGRMYEAVKPHTAVAKYMKYWFHNMPVGTTVNLKVVRIGRKEAKENWGAKK